MLTGRNILGIFRGVVQSYIFFPRRKNYLGKWGKLWTNRRGFCNVHKKNGVYTFVRHRFS